MPEELRASKVHAAIRRAARALRRGLAPLRLRGVSRLGARACVHGAPHVENHGTIVIGDDLVLSSTPAVSHLVAGPGALIAVGDRVSIGAGASIASNAEIRIGSGVRIGPHAIIMDTDFHDTNGAGDASSAPVVLGEDARIDPRVTILKGARVGAGAWIAAGSVVSSAIPPGAFAAGVPARVTKPRGQADQPEQDLPGRLARVVAETFVTGNDVALSDRLDEIPGWSSLGALRLLLAVEEEFRVTLADDALASARSVDDLIDMVSRRLTTIG